MYTPEQKAAEKQTVFNTSSWTDKRQVQDTTSKNINISLDDLLKPQYDQDGQVNYNNDNSVYNPESNLGGSVFGKNNLDYYLDQVEEQKKKKEQQEKQVDNKKNMYYIAGTVAIAYLGYRFL
jgi:hypothetical protein